MKKTILVLVAALAMSVSAFAQRESVPYVGIGVISDFSHTAGGGLTVGFRNYNRHAFVSFGIGAEAFGFYVPYDHSSQLGIFGIPEIGVAIGPEFFKVYPHSGMMFGYNSYTGTINWGGKNGMAFEFGRHLTVDFSTYAPNYNYYHAIYAANFIWRFGY